MALQPKLLVLALVATLSTVTSGTATAEDYRKLSFELFDAAREGNLESVSTLLERGVPIHARNRFGNTALIFAARAKQKEVIDLLLDSGADINKPNLSGKTALMEASLNGDLSLAKYLVAKGASVNAETIEHFTALIFATYHGHKPTITPRCLTYLSMQGWTSMKSTKTI